MPSINFSIYITVTYHRSFINRNEHSVRNSFKNINVFRIDNYSSFAHLIFTVLKAVRGKINFYLLPSMALDKPKGAKLEIIINKFWKPVACNDYLLL